MTRGERKGLNEAWFRDLNERLEQRALVKRIGADPFEVVCECDREECTDRISIGIAVYEAVRVAPIRFVVAPGHSDPACERIVASTDEYEIVEKLGDAAEIANAENPRS